MSSTTTKREGLNMIGKGWADQVEESESEYCSFGGTLPPEQEALRLAAITLRIAAWEASTEIAYDYCGGTLKMVDGVWTDKDGGEYTGSYPGNRVYPESPEMYTIGGRCVFVRGKVAPKSGWLIKNFPKDFEGKLPFQGRVVGPVVIFEKWVDSIV